jgi:hypothetical protein
MTSLDPWEKLRPELAALNGRLLAWQQQVKDELAKLLDPAKASAGGYGHEEQHQALRHAIAKAGDGPRSDLNQVMDRLCAFYLSAASEQRVEVRAFLGTQTHLLHDLWGYTHRAAEQVRAGGGDQWLRFGVAIASIEDLRGDYHDTLAGLGDLYLAAVEAGLHPERVFGEIAQISSEEANPEGTLRELLKNFEKTQFFREEIQPQLSRQLHRS